MIFRGEFLFKIKLLVKKIREEKNMSLQKLAILSGISKTHLSDIERNLKMPSLLVMIKISRALKVPITDLYEVLQ